MKHTNTKHTNTLRLQAAATQLVASALVMFVGVAATHTAHAVEQVSNAQLSKQTGAAKYYTGACNQHTDFVACIDAGPDATCASLNTTTNYRTIRHGYDYCSGTRLTNGTGPCQRDLSSVNAVERREYSNIRNKIDCVDTGLLMNYLSSNWFCPHEDCRPAGTAPSADNPTGQ